MQEPRQQPVYVFEGFRLDAQRRMLFGADGQPIQLTPRLFDALLYFVERRGELLTKKQLLEAIWPRAIVEEHNLNKTVSELRRVLGESPEQHKFFVTKPGHGYRFVANVAIAPLLPQSSGAADVEAAADAETGGSQAKHETGGDSTPLAMDRRSRPRRLLFVGGAVASVSLLAGGIGARLFEASVPDSTPGLRLTPLFFEREGGETPQVILGTAWKPDGKAIAFGVRKNGLLPQPYVLYLDGSSAQPLTRGVGTALPELWTQAGEVLLDMPVPDRMWTSAGLWSVPAVGGQPEPLFMFPRGVSHVISITQDGSTAAALRQDEDDTWGVWTGSITGGVLERYEPAPFGSKSFVNQPQLSFSPDGRNILLMWNPLGGGEQAWLLPFPPDPRRPPRRVLDTLPYHRTTPKFSWLPDNRHIVLTVDGHTMTGRLYLADTVSGKFRPLTDDNGTVLQIGPVVSPDGTRLVFNEVSLNLDIVTMNVHTAEVSPVIATNRREEMPAWAADGKRFVYVTDRSGEPEIWLHDQDAGERPLITAHDFPLGTTDFLMAPAISPDGTRVVYQRVSGDTRGAKEARLWMSSLTGGAPVRLRERDAQELAGSWSPDGAWYAYEELNSDGTQELKKVRVSGTSEPETLASGIRRSAASVPVWSPDGRWILFDDDGIKLTPADGGPLRDIGVKDAVCTFARAQELLYCIEGLAQGPSKLVERRFDGTARVVAAVAREHVPQTAGSPGLRLSLTADGEGLTYGAGILRVELLLGDGLAKIPLP